MSFLNALSSQDVVLSQRASRQADQTAAVKDLENTIARFQAILTDDDRKNLQKLKTEPHDAQSIIMFTARLDRFDPKRRGKSVASRLASFLQTIEQFTPIVDTYIQSNPEIAALVWGSVRLTFQVCGHARHSELLLRLNSYSPTSHPTSSPLSNSCLALGHCVPGLPSTKSSSKTLPDSKRPSARFTLLSSIAAKRLCW